MNDWVDTLHFLSKKINKDIFLKFIQPLQPQYKEDVLVLYAPNIFVKNIVSSNFLNEIKEALPDNKFNSIVVKIGTSSNHNKSTKISSNKEGYKNCGNTLNKKIKNSILNKDWTFKNYVVGNSNRFAYKVAKDVSESDDKIKILLIKGGCGLGKTHLMHALGHCCLSLGKNVVHAQSSSFLSGMMLAFSNRTVTNFLQPYFEADVLLFDDIQFMAGKPSCQTQLLHILTRLKNSGKLIVITFNNLSNIQNSNLSTPISSILFSNLVVEIKSPDIETKKNILLNKLNNVNFNIDDEALLYIASDYGNDIRMLESCITQLDCFNSLGINSNLNTKKTFSKEEVKSILCSSKKEKKKISIDDIIKIVADYYIVNKKDLMSKSRVRNIVLPRQIIMWMARSLTTLSLPHIGNYLGGRDHTTVLSACKKIDKITQENLNFKNEINELIKKL